MSIWHLLILLVIIILVFGPSRLEGIGSSLGKAIKGFKKGLDEEETQVTSIQKDKEDKKETSKT